MKITINTDILKRYKLSLGEFLVLLMSHYKEDYISSYDSLISKGLAEKDLFKEFSPILSNNTKNLIARILIESDDKAVNCGLDIEGLAKKLQEIYPDGIKAGKTYKWRGELNEITFKLLILIVKYDFLFTEEEAIAATKEYVSSFKAPFQYMHTLRNFLLYTKKDTLGDPEIESVFMTIIDNNRSNKPDLAVDNTSNNN